MEEVVLEGIITKGETKNKYSQKQETLSANAPISIDLDAFSTQTSLQNKEIVRQFFFREVDFSK